ncbi:hypothetical protein CL616_05225 [archaeon]|nr:hypothetical protein [archaeon]
MAVIAFDYFAILIASVVSFLFGWLWHSPLMFGEILMGKKKKEKVSALPFIGHFVTLLIMAWVLSMLIVNVGISTFEGALLFAGLIWLGFFVTTKLGMIFWEQKTTAQYFITIAYDLINVGVLTLILFFL